MASEQGAASPSAAAPHILIVDDDPQLRGLVSELLRANAYRVTAARNGREMAEAMKANQVDLIVLDLMLPGASGLDLCRELRKTSTTPVIMLTARGEETDRVLGLELGADDYLAKPFSSRELLARIRALLRRAAPPRDPTHKGGQAPIVFDGWVVDPLRRELTNQHGVVVDLSAGEYDLLQALLEAPQRVLSREHLLDAARHRAATGFDRSIDVLISRLRRKIDEPDGESKIKTVRGAGYMFLPAVTRR